MWSIMYSFCAGVAFTAFLVAGAKAEMGAHFFFLFVTAACLVAAFAAKRIEHA